MKAMPHRGHVFVRSGRKRRAARSMTRSGGSRITFAPGFRFGPSAIAPRIVQEVRATVSPMSYVPGDEWEARAPGALGLSPHGLAAAVEYHREHESMWPRDFITASGRYIGIEDEA